MNLKSSSSFSPAGHKVSNSSGRTGNHGRDDSAFRLGNGNGNSNTVKITRVGDDLSSHSVSKSMDMEGGYELGVKEIRVDIETAVGEC